MNHKAMPHTFVVPVLLSIFMACFASSEAFAQNVQYASQVQDSAMRNTLRVNPTTRAVEFQIPLGYYPGRGGLDVPVTLSYSSKVWQIDFQGFNPGAPPPHGTLPPFTIVTAEYGDHSVAGWTSTIGFPSIDFQPSTRLYDSSGNTNVSGNCSIGCYVLDRIVVWMPDGSGHELRSTDQPRPIAQAAPDNLYSVDGSRLRYQRSTQTLFMPDGSRYLYGEGKYVDRNGNTLILNAGFQDTLGRQLNNPLPYTPGTTPLSPTDQSYSLPGFGNTPLNYTLKWRALGDVLTTPEPLRHIADSACPPGTGNYTPKLFTSDLNGRTCIGNADVVFNPVVLHQIVLPNGRTYTFTYDIFGAINKIVLPTGGYERYEYEYAPPVSSPINFSFVYAQTNRGVAKQFVSHTGSSSDEVQWQYSSASNYVNVIAPDGTRTERYMWTDGVSSWGYSADSSRAGKTFDERVYSASGQMLRRKLTEWAQTGSNATGNPSGTQIANRNARITRVVEMILDNGGGPALAKTTTFGYDTTYQFDVGVEQTSANEFDFVEVDLSTAQTIPIGSLSTIPNGTLLRTIEVDYATSDINYRSRNLLGLVTATRVKNGSGVVVSQSANTYDEAAFPLLTYPSVTAWTDPATTFRGNITSVTRWLNFNGSTLSTFPQGTYVSKHSQYDQCGSLRKNWDARDTSLTNPLQLEYADTYNRAYLTSMTSPDPDAAGPLTALTASTTYDSFTGLVTAITNPNSHTTTFDYTDPLNRLKQTVRAADDSAAKNQTTFNYDDIARSVTTTSDLAAYNDNIIKVVRIYDGLGRLQEMQRHEGGGSYISVQQQYDALGRIFKTSNPMRSGDPLLWTTSTFDALGRLSSITSPDSAAVSRTYVGNTETTTDQAGKQRKSISNAIGQLTQIIEAPNDAGLQYLTSYEYDALDNLTHVTQGTQHRYFMYDSMTRLIRSRNPEQGANAGLNLTDPLTLNGTWSNGYQYDANGNVTQSVDPRGITTTSGYDALNRNTTISYANDPSGTLPVTFVYDLAVNGKGVSYQRQTTGAAGSLTTIDSYDAMGRPLTQRQQFFVSGAWGQSYTVQRTYNRASNVTSQTYPSGRVVNYGFDNAGRLTSGAGNLGGTPLTYSDEILYSPFGGIAKERFGTNTAIYNKSFYNNRGQLAEIRESTTSATDTSADRGAVVNHFSNQCEGMCTPTSSMTDNNGNLRKQDVIIPGSTTRRQEYDYDPLNRLNWARELLSGVEQWKQQFTYDRWGNRTINTAASYGGVNEKDFTVNTANNRLGVPGGQAGVMDYDNAGNLINDTYSGAGNRTYDAQDRIISAWGGNNQAQLYAYDGVGKRIKRTVNGTETWQVYGFSGELLAEYPANGALASPNKEYGYRNGQLLITAEPGQTPVNVALGSNGATVTASSSYSGFAASGAINGDRKGLFVSQNGYWSTASAGFPAWLEVQFNGSKTITEIDVFGVQDNYNAPVEPTESMTFTLGGLIGFDVQYWNGSAWVTISGASVSGNNKVWRKFSFAPITTTKIRVLSNASPDNYSRLTELEAWTGPSPAPRYNLALSSMGAVATASNSYNAGYGPGGTNNGDRKSLNWTNGGGWNDSGPPFPDWLQIDFGSVKLLDEVDVFTLQDNWWSPSEPTESMTFTQYGLTGYQVEYWNGASWVAISGASVSGNNKVWRKFTFSPISTSKIRVVTSASVDGYSRLTEVEAYGPSDTGAANGIRWLVSDHLGTPRMTFDVTGRLENMTRHDYLPFGEELFAPIGGRSAAEGYGGADGVRQQFTAQERDLETNLDYFNARYYSSAHGRFTSPDPFGGSGFVSVPQSWNKYAYVLNRPFVFTDPSGEIWLTKDHVTFIWVEDAEYNRNKDAWKGYFEANGAVIQYAWSTNCGDKCKGIRRGQYVRLDEGGGLDPVEDPTMQIFAAYDELKTMMPVITGSIRESGTLYGPPGGRRFFYYGNSKTERLYDENGRVWVDIDSGHDHGAGDPHVHWWDWNNPSDPRDPQGSEMPPGWWQGVWDNGEPYFDPNGKVRNPRPGTIPILPADMPMTMPIRPGVPVRPMVPLRPILVP